MRKKVLLVGGLLLYSVTVVVFGSVSLLRFEWFDTYVFSHIHTARVWVRTRLLELIPFLSSVVFSPDPQAEAKSSTCGR